MDAKGAPRPASWKDAAPRDQFHLAAIVQILKSLAGRLFCPPTAPAFA
jgi:hypothetical protein